MKSKLKRLFSVVLAVVMVGYNLGGLVSVKAIDGDGPTVKNDPNGPTILDDGVRLHKTARAVPGFANEWEVTLKIEAPAVTVTSDTVVVIDRSNSMSSTMLSNAKAAATSLAEELLPEGNRVNRVAVLSFGTDVLNKTNGFSDSFSVVNNAINGPSGIAANGGGTFTQGAIHAAAQLLASSSATHKSIVLLSDGVPSFSYDIKNVVGDDFEVGHTMIGTGSRQFKVMTSANKYDYTEKVGDGSRSIWQDEGREMWDDYGEVWIGGRRYNAYYDHGNSAISEANFFKATGGTLHTVAYNAGTLGNSVLNSMASEGKSHTSSGEDLEEIFDDIAGEISSLVGNSHVHDVMGEGVYVDNATHAADLDWDPVFTFNSTTNMYEATTTYRVSANEAMLEDSAHETEEGFHRLNRAASITYGDNKTGDFPVPYVKPFYINVKKELVGQEANGQVFNFEFTHPDNTKSTYQVKAGETHSIMEPFPVGPYSINETSTSNNAIAFENYLIDYKVDGESRNSFQINEEHSDHIDITMTNTYETVVKNVDKKWDDDNNRDGKRSNYSDLAIAVKDGNKYVAYQALDLTVDKSYSFEGLPKNRNGSAIDYTIVEARGCSGSGSTITCRSDFVRDDDYEATVQNGVVTNKHTPDTVELTIKKKWDTSAGTLPTVTPGFVTVEVSNDKNDTVETVTLQGESYAEWTGTFEGYKYEDGQEINYIVTEKKIGDGALNANNTLYVYNGDVLEGKWVATREGVEVTNTWTPAETEYTGAGEFYIMKTDQDGEALAGVTFTVGNETYTTGNDGTVKVEFSASTEEPEDEYTFNIEETDAPDFYDIIEGTEVLEATTDLDLDVDTENLVNKYTKSFEFTVKTSVDGYVWQNDDSTLLVTDQALADELVIEKTFEGISAKAFEDNSQIKFDISGPEGFTAMTVGNGDDECEISGSKLVCTIDGSETLLPVGEYTVTEKDADIDNFTYTSEPTSKEVKKTVALGGTAEFKFKNIYEPFKTASFKVKKVWEDDSDRDGIRPDELEVTLLADGEVYGDSVKLTGDNWEYEWTELPLVNEDAEVIEYSAEEEDLGDDYESDGGEMKNGVFTFTNTHEPEMHDDITVKKIWAGEGNELARPGSVLVELLADGEVIDTASIVAGQNNEWTHTFTDLYKNADGEEVVYSVQESKIGETAFGENESTIVVYKADGETLEGKWVKSIEKFEVTNTWTPAATQIDYNGESEFTIKKVDEEYEPLSGVIFEINDNKEETDRSGEITVEVPITTTDEDEDEAKTEESFEYEISEYEAKEGYDEVEGSATVGVDCTSTLAADSDTLTNYYTKTCTFKKTDGSDKFVWDGEDLTLTVINKRSLAKSLIITKTFSGVNASVLKDVTFTIEGPEDFGDNGTMTLTVGEDCTSSEDKIVCEVDAKIPTGEYTVTESNAEIEFFTLNVTGDNGEEKNVEKNDEVEFEIDNEYIVDTTYFDVVKIWEDEHNKDGSRPETLTVNLLANGEVVDDEELSADNEIQDEDLPEEFESSDIWVYTFEGLPVADENAEVIEYYAEEILDAEGYEQIEEIGGMHTVVFVNMHEPVDPCEEGGCGGEVPPVKTPETGKLTKSHNNGAVEGAWTGNMIGGAMMVILGISLVAFGKRKEVKLTK